MTTRDPAAWIGALAWLSVVALAGVGLSGVEIARFVPVRMAAASAAVLLLPGLSLMWLLRKSAPLPELLPTALGLSIAVVTALTVLAIEAHWPIRWVAAVLLAIGALGVLSRVVGRNPAALRGGPRIPSLGWAGLVALAGAAAVFYELGGTLEAAPTGEEILHVTIVRKIWGNRPLGVSSLMYVPDSPTTYLYAPYHALLALVARLSGLDPLVAFFRIRATFVVLAILTMVGLVHVVTRRAEAAAVALWIFLGLLLFNVAGQTTAADGGYLYWAQLAPLSHLGDFALGIMLPLCLFAMLSYLQADGQLLSWSLAVAVAVIVSALLVHVREGVQVVFYLACFAAALLAFRRDRRLIARTAILLAAVISAGLLFRLRHDAVVGHIAVHEGANKQMVLSALEKVLAQPAGGMVAPAAYFREERLLFLPVPVVCLLAGPFLLALAGETWALFCGSVLLIFPLVFRIPWLAWLYVRLTYSEVLVTPLRNVAHVCYLLVAVAAYAALAWRAQLEKRRLPAWFGAVWLATASLLVWGGVGMPVALLAARSQDAFFLLWALAAAAGCLVAWRRRRAFGGSLLPPIVPGGVWAALGLIAIVASFWLIRVPPSLIAQLARARARVPIEQQRRWYRAALGAEIPYDLLQLIGRRANGATVLADFRTRLLLPMMIDVYVPTSGYGYSTDMGGFVEALEQVRGERADVGADPWLAYQARSAYYGRLISEAPPVFSPEYSDEQQLQFMRLLGADFLLYKSGAYPQLERLVSSRPAAFELVAESRPFRFLRIHRELL